MADSLNSRDLLTSGHSTRVAEFARMIASSMKFTDEDLDVIKVASILHNYGKVGVDDAVLRKNGKLDAGIVQALKDSLNGPSASSG